MLQVCTHRAKSREDNEEQTVVIGLCVHQSYVLCVSLSAHSTFSLPEGSSGREYNLTFIKALWLNSRLHSSVPENSPHPPNDVWLPSTVITSVKMEFTCAERKSGQGCVAVAVSSGRSHLLLSLWFHRKGFLKKNISKLGKKENEREGEEADMKHRLRVWVCTDWRFPFINW